MKKILICLLVCLTFVTVVHAETFRIKEDYDMEFNWDFNYLEAGSNSYNLDLALSSLMICASARSGQQTVQDNLEQLGFSDIEFFYFDDKIINKPATIIASSKIGDTVYFVVCIRGTSNVEDAITDVVGGVFNGFYLAGVNVLDLFVSYRNRHYPDQPKENQRLLITGHSLGGASAGQLARQIEMNGVLYQFDTYVYTFASPRYDIEGDKPSDYYNVYNHIISEDMVPKVPAQYSRVGKDLTYSDFNQSMSLLDYINTLFFMENLGHNAGLLLMHHSSQTYYQVIKYGDYDTDSPFVHFLKDVFSMLMEMAERCLH